MRRTTAGVGGRIVVGVVAALAMVLAGCSSSVQGQGQAGSTASSSTPTAESSSTSESSSTAQSSNEETESSDSTEASTGESTGQSTGAAASADLDPDTLAFFQAFCGGAASMSQFTSPDTSGQTIDQVQATIVQAYTMLSSSASDTAFLLEELKVPPIENGQALYDNAIERFRVIGAVYGDGAQTIDALVAPSESELRTAVGDIEDQVRELSPETVDVVEPEVRAAVQALPECADLF